MAPSVLMIVGTDTGVGKTWTTGRARAFEARVLLVAADRLGTINHTLMALKVLEMNQLKVLGIVLTAPEQPDASTGSNAAAISRLSGQARVLRVPRVADPPDASDHFQEVTQWLDLA